MSVIEENILGPGLNKELVINCQFRWVPCNSELKDVRSPLGTKQRSLQNCQLSSSFFQAHHSCLPHG